MARRRTRRRPLLMDNAVVVGGPRTAPIVYAFRFPSRPFALKVGTSTRGLERVREQTTGYPEAPEVLLVFHHRDAKAIERRVQEALADRQMHGAVGTEWFRAGWEDLIEACPELRAAMGRQRWRHPLRWVGAAVGWCLWALLLPLWWGLADAGSGAGVPWHLASAYAWALWAGSGQAWGLVGAGVGHLWSAPVQAVPMIGALLSWTWWVAARR